MSGSFEGFFDYLDSGGLVMYPLLLATLLLWYAIGYRVAVLVKARSRNNVRRLIDDYKQGRWKIPDTLIEEAIVKGFELRQQDVTPLRRYLDDVFSDFESELNRFQVLIKTIVMIAPLMGLLGTVGGMIETFDSLQDMALYTQSGGIAAGISQALVTTQFGLAIAIPGLIVNGYLLRRKDTVSIELAQIKDILTTTPVRRDNHAL